MVYGYTTNEFIALILSGALILGFLVVLLNIYSFNIAIQKLNERIYSKRSGFAKAVLFPFRMSHIMFLKVRHNGWRSGLSLAWVFIVYILLVALLIALIPAILQILKIILIIIVILLVLGLFSN